MTEVLFGFGSFLLVQCALLFLAYCGIVTGLPWWVIWFPCLIVVGFIALAIVIFVLWVIIATLWG